jgi:hypothetical protein
MEEIPEEIPVDANEEDVKRWLAAELVARFGLTPERAKAIVAHALSDARLDSQLPQ